MEQLQAEVLLDPRAWYVAAAAHCARRQVAGGRRRRQV